MLHIDGIKAKREVRSMQCSAVPLHPILRQENPVKTHITYLFRILFSLMHRIKSIAVVVSVIITFNR
jgi:hypothetical protein